MKKITLLLLSLLLAAPAYADLTTNIKAYWNLSEASGTRNDSAGVSNLHLTDNNTVTQAAGPGSNNAAQFTAANSESLSRGHESALNFGDIDFTITAWAYLADKSATYTIVAKYEGASDDREYLIRYNSSSDRFEAYISPDGTSGSQVNVVANNLGSPSATTWYFLTLQYDATANLMYISANAGTQDSASETGGAFAGVVEAFAIGARALTGTPTEYLNGRVALVGMWSRKLSGAEITQLYNSGSGCTYAELTTTCAGGGASSQLRRRVLVY